MNFALTEEQRAIAQMVGEMARAGRPTTRQLAELGLLGVCAAADVGGTELGLMDLCVVLEELAACHPSLARQVQVHNVLGLGALLEAGTAAQIAAWAERLASGQALASFGATRDGETVGAVPFGGEADVVVVLSEDGFQLMVGARPVCEPAAVLGFRELRSTDLALHGQHVEPMAADAPRCLIAAHITAGAIGVGIARGALTLGARYSTERVQFGGPIARFGAMRMKLHESAIRTEAARLLVHQAARAHDAGETRLGAAAMARKAGCDAALRATDHALQIHGGYGYTVEYGVECLYRDARALAAAVGGTLDDARDDIAETLVGAS